MPQAHFASPLLNEYVERDYQLQRAIADGLEDDRTAAYQLDDILINLRSHQHARITASAPSDTFETLYTIEYTQSPYPQARYYESELSDYFSRSTNR